RSPAVQARLLQGIFNVLRFDRDVRTRRRGELGVADYHRRRFDGAATTAEQPDGPALRRPSGRRGADCRSFPRAGTPARRLQREQSARVAQAWGRLPSNAAGGPSMNAPSARKALPFNDIRHLQAHQFLVDEAYLLDAQQYAAWLDTLTDDIRYVMPVRVTTAR